MNRIEKYLHMSYDDLDVEILKIKKKIKEQKETIRLLEKLQIAESAKSISQTSEITLPENINCSTSDNQG
jgi:hypothetical protein